MAFRTFPANAKLLIFSDEGQPLGQNEKLDPSSTRYQEAERCIHMALMLLESSEGKNSLVKVANAIVNSRRSKKPPKPTLYQSGDMLGWINVFLTCMRNDFPMTYLSSMQGEAMAVRQANDMKSLGAFEPKKIGYMDINRYILNNMISAHKRNDGTNYMLFRFQMVISIAHEIVHFLTGFLTGEKADRVATPPDVAAAGYGNRTTGEAGRYWEQFFLGGQVEMWPSVANKAGTPMYMLQAGTPYLMADGTPKAAAKVVDANYIKQFMGGSKLIPGRLLFFPFLLKSTLGALLTCPSIIY